MYMYIISLVITLLKYNKNILLLCIMYQIILFSIIREKRETRYSKLVYIISD